jgi:uncharacterized protein (DUF305 family)
MILMNKKLLALTTAAVAAVVAFSGCAPGSGSGSGTGTPDHGNMGHSNSAPPAAADHNSADTMFAQMMIPHHAQAVEMSDIVLKKQDIPAAVTSLATRIKDAQAPEIEQMTGWLKSWNEPTHIASGGHGMAGMMSEEDLAKLDAAQGTEAARLFLTQMIAHHEGAIVMAKTEMAEGKHPDAVKLSKDIVTAQEAEIQEMRSLLGSL